MDDNARLLAKHHRAVSALSEFMEDCVGEYGLKWVIEHNGAYDETDSYFTVYVHSDIDEKLYKQISCKVWRDTDGEWAISVEIGEDTWECCSTYDKYFWMAFLEWPW